MLLEGKVVVVTGANGSLGKAVCRQVCSLGGKVIRLDIALDEPDGDSYAIDLLDSDATGQCFAEIGQFDVLLNLAGGFAMGAPVLEESDDQWEEMFNLNVATLRNVLKAGVSTLKSKGKGSIVNVGALGAREGQGLMSAYCASKSVVMRLTESLSEELKESGINVNAVLPSIIDGPANRQAMPDANPARWVAPEDLAKVICFLASDAARSIHGALLPVRGLS